MTRVRGVALLLVLWLLVLMTGVVSAFALTARVEGLEGRWQERSVAARLAAESGIELAAIRLAASDQARRWRADGRPYNFAFEGWRVQVRVQDESGKVDLNAATPDVMSGLLVALGEDPQSAARLTSAINDWHDDDSLLSAGGGAEDPQYAAEGLPYGAKDRPFELASELRLVLGVSPALYARMAPHVTVYSGMSRPEAASASAPVLRALGMDAAGVAQVEAERAGSGTGVLAATGSGTYSISCIAVREDGTRAQIRAVVRLGAGGVGGQLYTPLAWRTGTSD